MATGYWIAPTGETHAVKFHTHGKFANAVLQTDLPSEQAILQLALQGWLHIGLSPFVGFTAYRDLSDEQSHALFTLLKQANGLIVQNILAYIHA